MSNIIKQRKDLIRHMLHNARGIAWDGCHKIYVLMDDERVRLTEEYGYEHIVSAAEASADEMLNQVIDWYESSCELRFVTAIFTHDDPNRGFVGLIEQGDDGGS